jgi:hypothetical protein
MHLQVALHRRSAWLSGGPILSKRGYEMQLTFQVPNDINRMKQIVKLLWKVLMWIGANVIEHCAQRSAIKRAGSPLLKLTKYSCRHVL